jgi:hypothetical protein
MVNISLERTPPLTIRVHEVTDFLGGVSDSIKTNKTIAVSSTDIGSKASMVQLIQL